MPSQAKLARMFPGAVPKEPKVKPPKAAPKVKWVYTGKVVRVKDGARSPRGKERDLIPASMRPSAQPVRNRSRYLGERPPVSVQKDILKKWHARKDKFK